MRFAKYHGLGNDFIVVDLRSAASAEAATVQEPGVVRALCDRQFGIGADGVLAILPATSAAARMRVLNADGSEAEMCGNGIRCVAVELHERGGVNERSIAIDTGAGRLVCDMEAGQVTVSMGPPRLLRGEIPMTGPAGERCIEQPLAIAGQPTHAFTGVSMGNPHAIAFVGSLAEARALASSLGPVVEKHAWFLARTNVEFVAVKSARELDLVVWERGVGLTLACGTGACATVVAATLTGRVDEGAPVRVNLPGGPRTIRVAANYGNVFMTGPALRVFDGEVDPRAVSPRP